MQTAVSPGEFRRYAAPGVLGMIGISCYILADTFFVAKGTGSLGLAALNIAIPAYNLMNGLGLMVGVGGATHYSLCRAQGDAVEADRTFTHTLLLGLCIALLFVLTGTFGVVPLSRLLGANAETLDMTAVYLRLLLCFAPFFVTNNVMIAFVRNDGEPGRAMAGMIAGSLFNIVFDWVFIFPCGLGMFGAALATGASPLVSRSAEADRRRLLRWTVTTALAISALMYVLVFVFASPITAVFNSEHDPALAACAVPGLRIYFAGFLAACINIIAAAYFSAAGQASRGFIISLVRSIIAIPPVLFALSALLGVTGVWLTFPAVEALACALSLLFILRSPK